MCCVCTYIYIYVTCMYIYICLKLVYTVYPLNCHFDRENMPGMIFLYVWVQVVLGQVATSCFFCSKPDPI